MTVISFISKFSWASLFILVWLKSLGFMDAKPALTWGALIIFGLTALVGTFFYIGMESMLWDKMYPKTKSKIETILSSKTSEPEIPDEEL